MIELRQNCLEKDRAEAARRHMDWLLSPGIAGATNVPFRPEAVEFHHSFEILIALYDRAMTRADQEPVKGKDLE